MDMTKLEKAIREAWAFSTQKLYYPKTHQIYDYLTCDTLEETVCQLPTKEEIEASFPNPCGWGTGMEDSTLSLCPLLEAALAKYAVTGDETMKQWVYDLAQGLIINGTASEEKGFIARAVDPVEGKYIYMDSSRDQYTIWVFAAHLLINSPLTDPEQEKKLREILVWVAEKAERDITPENDGYFLRLDGKPGVVSRMDSEELGSHEVLRLSMIYAAAYEASGDPHWQEMYLSVRDRLLEQTEKTLTVAWWVNYARGGGYVYGLYQHQYSARLLWDCEKDDVYKARYWELMRRAAVASQAYLEMAYEVIDQLCIDEPKAKPWREADFHTMGLIHGRSYFMPRIFDSGRISISKNMRNASEVVVIQCLCPGYTMTEETKAMFCEFVERAHFSAAANYWPILFCDAWWLARREGQL